MSLGCLRKESCLSTIGNMYMAKLKSAFLCNPTHQRCVVCRIPFSCGVSARNAVLKHPSIPMSASTWKYSFGKYLELSFWSADLHARAGICPHDLHRDHLRYFGYKDFALRIRYDPIDLLEIIVPRLRITWKVENDLKFRNEVYTKIEHRLTRFMVSVKLRPKEHQCRSLAS